MSVIQCDTCDGYVDTDFDEAGFCIECGVAYCEPCALDADFKCKCGKELE